MQGKVLLESIVRRCRPGLIDTVVPLNKLEKKTELIAAGRMESLE
jgi:hypothetical protein